MSSFICTRQVQQMTPSSICQRNDEIISSSTMIQNTIKNIQMVTSRNRNLTKHSSKGKQHTMNYTILYDRIMER